ncbi:hypothetical protein OG943_03765 [Amycolatopsis sp. NBC_00345]
MADMVTTGQRAIPAARSTGATPTRTRTSTRRWLPH